MKYEERFAAKEDTADLFGRRNTFGRKVHFFSISRPAVNFLIVSFTEIGLYSSTDPCRRRSILRISGLLISANPAP